MGQHDITILTGEESWYSASKTYGFDSDGGVQMTADFAMGSFFCYHTEKVTPGAEVFSLMEIFGRLADMPRSFRIYGEIRREFDRRDVVHRRGEFFVDPLLGSQLLIVDVDGWETGVEWWTSREALHTAIVELLLERRLDYLLSGDLICVLSQSAWPGDKLKCHLYAWLDHPVLITDMNAWAKAVNLRLGDKVIDPAMYQTVQVDYTARRQTSGVLGECFDDHMRVSLVRGDDTLLAETQYDGLRSELKHAMARVGTEGLSSVGEVKVSGRGLDVIAQAGTGGNINEYGYRGAARIVREHGKAYVLEHIEDMARQLWTLAWYGKDGIGGIAQNSGGVRGGAEDAQVYTIDRFRQYLKSACDASIGDQLDGFLEVIRKAMTEGARRLLAGDVIDAGARLQHGWLGHYEEIRAELLALRGFRIANWDREVATRRREMSAAARVSQEDALEAITLATPEVISRGDLLDEDGRLLEGRFYEFLAMTYDQVGDEDSTVIIDALGSEMFDLGGYSLVGDGFRSHVETRALRVLGQLDPLLGLNPRTPQIVAGILATRASEVAERNDGFVLSNRWGKRRVRDRYYQSPAAGRGCRYWVNLGMEGEGRDARFNCMLCTGEGHTRMTWLEALEKHPDAPIWTGSYVGLGVGSNDASCFVGRGDAWSRDEGIRGHEEGLWASRLFDLIHVCRVEDELMVICWLISVVLEWDTRFILQLSAPQGSGKTIAAQVLCSLVDPASNEDILEATKRRMLSALELHPDKVKDALRGRSTAIIDNLSSLTAKQQDVLCTVATGTSAARKGMYVDTIFSWPIKCSLILTGINNSHTRSDLADRLLNAEIDPDGLWQAEWDIGRAFNGRRSTIIDGLLKTASQVSERLRKDRRPVGRSLLKEVVAEIYLGQDGMKALEDIHMSDTIEMLNNSPFALSFSAWLNHDDSHWGEFGKFEGESTPVGDIYKSYKTWFRDNTGKKFVLDGVTDVELSVYQSDKKRAIPVNVSSFGKALRRDESLLAICRPDAALMPPRGGKYPPSSKRLNSFFQKPTISSSKSCGVRYIRITTK